MRHTLPLMLPLLLSSPLIPLGCSTSTTAPEDTGISFTPPDASPDTGTVSTDATTDAMMSETDIGQICSGDTDCEVFCLTDGEGFRDGYCSGFCDDETPCPSGSACVQVSRDQSQCFAECNPSADTRECRAGYGCAASVMLPAPVCIPGCTDDTDCADGRICNPEFGGSCYNPASEWGDACEGSSDCPDGAFCFAEAWRGWPGGMCVAFGCDPADAGGGGCPAGTACIPGGRSGYGRCISTCETADDCRDGYDCGAPADYPERLVCEPACDDSSQCTSGGICNAEGTCG